jgi:uracil-DNA glycosylase family 4
MSSQEFLEEAWDTAKKKLPGWAYQAILLEARGRAGGKASGRYRNARAAALSLKVIKSEHDGVCIAMRVPKAIADKLVQPGGEKAEDLHVTLAYMGPISKWSQDELNVLYRTVAEHVRGSPPLIGKISGAGKFNADPPCIYASVDCPELSAFRERLMNALDGAAIKPDDEHGFDPHITLRYGEGPMPELEKLELAFETVCVYAADTVAEVKLDGFIRALDLPNAQGSTPGPSHQGRPLSPGEDRNTNQGQKLALAKAEVPSIGPSGSVLFVGSSPMDTDRLRGEPFSGPVGETLLKHYLAPLGLTREQVALTNVIPMVGQETEERIAEWRPWLLEEIARLRPKAVIALGRVAKQALGPMAHHALPNPVAARQFEARFGDEIARKLRAIRKKLDEKDNPRDSLLVTLSAHHRTGESAAQTSANASGRDARRFPIAKADALKKIVYGIVLDPYQVDAHNDWISPAEVEQTQEGYMRDSRLVSIHHMKPTTAFVVESFIEAYPSQTDRAKAFAGEPHRIYRRKFGDDYLHSGAWVLGTKLDDALWDAYQRGEIQAYSIEGFAHRASVSPKAMPKVDVVDLVPNTDL